MSPDALNQFPAAPVPTLSGFPMTLPTAVSQPTGMPSGPAGSMPLNLGQQVMGISLVGPVGGATAQASSGFMPTYPANQVNGETALFPIISEKESGQCFFQRCREDCWIMLGSRGED